MEFLKMNENKRLFNSWARIYDNPIFKFWMKNFHKVTLSNIQKNKSIVLDISCGTGELLRELVKRGFRDLYGIDISQKMLMIAKKKLPSYVKLSEVDVHNLPFQNNMFDYVTTTEAFHHYEKQERALQEMKRVTKTNGKIIVADINFFSRTIHWFFEKLEPGCVKINNKKQIKKLFNKVGLKVIKQKRTFLFAITTVGVVI